MKETFILLSFLKRHLRYFSVFAMVMVAQSLSAHDINSKVITYPAPPGLQTSPDLKVTADNIPIWVERADTNSPTSSIQNPASSIFLLSFLHFSFFLIIFITTSELINPYFRETRHNCQVTVPPAAVGK
jgi:hypothetical protein